MNPEPDIADAPPTNIIQFPLSQKKITDTDDQELEKILAQMRGVKSPIARRLDGIAEWFRTRFPTVADIIHPTHHISPASPGTDRITPPHATTSKNGDGSRFEALMDFLESFVNRR